jgi:cysteinyl-tRNA synthetase
VEKKADYGKLSAANWTTCARARASKWTSARKTRSICLWKARQRRRTGLGQPMGQRTPRLAHRVLGYERRALGEQIDIHGGGTT